MFDRTGIEERRHQSQFVVFRTKVQAFTSLPGVPKCPNCTDLISKFSYHRIRPGQAETPLNMGFHLRAQTQDEAPLRSLCQIPGGVG